MKKILLVLVAIIALFAVGVAFWIGAARGRAISLRVVRNQILADLRVANERNDTQLAEYLKARYYYYSNESGVHLRRGEGDFGAVNEKLLQGYSPGKGLTSFKAEYDAYKQIRGFVE
jgi:hypothetical protein